MAKSPARMRATADCAPGSTKEQHRIADILLRLRGADRNVRPRIDGAAFMPSHDACSRHAYAPSVIHTTPEEKQKAALGGFLTC